VADVVTNSLLLDLLICSAEIVGLFKQEKQVADSHTPAECKVNKKMIGLSTNCETIII